LTWSFGGLPYDFNQALIDDIALAFDWTPLREMAFLFSTLDVDLSTLDVEHIDDNVMC
jgi:hypothetical protein